MLYIGVGRLTGGLRYIAVYCLQFDQVQGEITSLAIAQPPPTTTEHSNL